MGDSATKQATRPSNEDNKPRETSSASSPGTAVWRGTGLYVSYSIPRPAHCQCLLQKEAMTLGDFLAGPVGRQRADAEHPRDKVDGSRNSKQIG